MMDAFSASRETQRRLAEDVSALAENVGQLENKDDVHFCISIGELRGISDSLATILAAAPKMLMCQAGSEVQTWAAKMSDVEMKWSHIISDTLYRGQLATRQLLHSHNRPHLVRGKDMLKSALYQVGVLTSSLGLDRHATSEMESVQYASAVFADAVKTVDILAGVSIVEELGKSPKGQAAAKAFLEKKLQVPKALIKRIEDVKAWTAPAATKK